MKITHIKDILIDLGYPLHTISLGKFDHIGEFTAKKHRDPSSKLYHSAGAFFRPNYERGLLIYALIKKYKIKSFLEIGFGRGYGSICAAMAMSDLNLDGKIFSVDPQINENHVKKIQHIFPDSWTSKICLYEGTSDYFFAENKSYFDMIYIDGDHRYDAVKKDWKNSEIYSNKIILFDDYHFPTKEEKDIEVSKVVDEITGYEKQIIRMDRRIFLDDRGYTDEQIDYGQVLIIK